jgi:hypothetical protein
MRRWGRADTERHRQVRSLVRGQRPPVLRRVRSRRDPAGAAPRRVWIWAGLVGASAMDARLLWTCVGIFALIASAFLSAFAGLYFTVQAVIDDTYRREFFSQVSQGLEQAVGVRKVYVAVRAHLAE